MLAEKNHKSENKNPGKSLWVRIKGQRNKISIIMRIYKKTI